VKRKGLKKKKRKGEKAMDDPKINIFKEGLRSGMIENFKQDGGLAPFVFYLRENEIKTIPVPDQILASQNGKAFVGQVIRAITHTPGVLATGIIIEAWGMKFKEDDKHFDSVMNGEMQVRDVEGRKDIILLIFSTPEKEEIIAYEVDCENKTVGEQFMGKDAAQFEGIFANFFDWNRN
jgi:hypothetical protein